MQENQTTIDVREDMQVAPVEQNDASYLMSQFYEGANQLFYTSMKLAEGDRGTAVKLYNALSDAESLKDYIGQTFHVTDVVAHPVQLMDEQSGEIVTAIRVILIDEEGKAYAAISEGLRSAIHRLRGIVGEPPWHPALKMVPVEKKTRKGFRVLTIQLEANQ